MLRTVVYMRRSSEDGDDKQLESIPRQEREIKTFLEKHNYITSSQAEKLNVDWDKDIFRESESAKVPGREIFREMIKKVEKGYYDVILCTEASRLSRNPVDTGTLVNIMDNESIKQIRTITNVYNSSSATERFTLNLFLSIAKFENDQRGINASSGMQNIKAKGGTTNLAPMGYRNVGLAKGDKRIEKDEDNFIILREMWDLFLTGQYKLTELYRKALNRGLTRISGYSSDDGKAQRVIPKNSTFRSMFSRTYYKGIIETDNGPIPGLHDPMVTPEEFDKAQLLLQKAGYKHGKTSSIKYENLLENILECGKTGNRFYVGIKKRFTCHCGHRYGSNSGPKECPKCGKVYEEKEYKMTVARYFEVKGAKHSIIEGGIKRVVSSIPIGFMENLIQDELNKIYIPKAFFEIMRKRLYFLWQEKEKKNHKRIKEKLKEIDEIDESKLNIVENAFGGKKPKHNTNQVVEDTIDSLADRIKSIEKDIAEIRDENDESFEIAWQALNTLFKAKEVFSNKKESSFEPKRNMLLSVFSNLKFIDGKIIPVLKAPFDLLAGGAHSKKSSYEKFHKSSDNPRKLSFWLPG